MAGNKHVVDSMFGFMSRSFSTAVSSRSTGPKILNPNYTPEAHRLSATYTRQQERLEKIARVQKESLEAKQLSDAVSLKQKQTIMTTNVNKKTGIPLYSMQPQKSSAHLYKEARLNKIPFESVAAAVSSTPEVKKSVLSRLWVPILAVVAVGAGIEVAVVYSSKATPDDNSWDASSSSDVVSYSVALHKDVYTRSTANLIQAAITDFGIRKRKEEQG
jgi:hypothetical protein